MSKNVFEKIIDREIPAAIVYEDDLVLAFRDINAKAPVHVLIVPKKNIPRLAEAKPGRLTRCWAICCSKRLKWRANWAWPKPAYRLVINNGPDGGETVPHLHCHILGGRA